MSKGDELLGIEKTNLYKKDLDNHIKELFNEINSTSDKKIQDLDIHLLYQLVIKRLSKFEPIFIKKLANVTNTCDIESETLKLLMPLKKLSEQLPSSIYGQIYQKIFEKTNDIIEKEVKKIEGFDKDLKDVLKSQDEKNRILDRIDSIIDSGMILLIDGKDNIEILEELLRIRCNYLKVTSDDEIKKSGKEKTYNECILNCMILSNRIAHELDKSRNNEKTKTYFAHKDVFIQKIIDRKEELKKDGIRIYKGVDSKGEKTLVIAQTGFPLTSVHCPKRSFFRLNKGRYERLDEFPLASKTFISPESYSSKTEYLIKKHGNGIIVPFTCQPYGNWTNGIDNGRVKNMYSNGSSDVPDYIMFNTLSVTRKYSIDQILLMISRMKHGDNSKIDADFSVIDKEYLLYSKTPSSFEELSKLDDCSCFESLIGTDLVTLLTNSKSQEIADGIVQDEKIDDQVKTELSDILEYWQGSWDPSKKGIKGFNKIIKDFLEKHKKKVAPSDSSQSPKPRGNAEQIGNMATAGQNQLKRADGIAKTMGNGKDKKV